VTPVRWLRFALEPALELLPAKLDTMAARALCVAICLQESGLSNRVQHGGSAVGYGQFELAGIRGVLTHSASRPLILSVMDALDYDQQSRTEDLYDAIRNNDILSAAFVRCLLWTLPQNLPAQNAPGMGLSAYLQAWRPGTPRPDAWPENWREAWDTVA
jgi:hypothetical protein